MSKRLLTRTYLTGRLVAPSAWSTSRALATEDRVGTMLGKDVPIRNYRRSDGTFDTCDEIPFFSIIGYGEDLQAVTAAKEGIINSLLISRYNQARGAPKS